MKEFDGLLERLKLIMKDGLYCEDSKLYVKCKVKYELHNLMQEYEPTFMKRLYDELEYKEDE